MLNIKPKTYNEAARLAKCLEVKKYIPDLSDEKIEEMYNYLTNNPKNKISISPEMISYINEEGETENATVLDSAVAGLAFGHILLGYTTYNMMNSPNNSDSGCSGCSACSGCSTGCSANNNNNNG